MKQQKRFLVSFLVIASVLLLAGVVSALPNVNFVSVKVNDIETTFGVSVIAGETVPVVVTFTSNTGASDVRMSATLEGAKVDVKKEAFVGDIESGHAYTKTLTLEVPYELQDEVSDNLRFVVKIWNRDFSENTESILRVQRPAYNVRLMSF